jgi:hypothetical protein
VGVVPRQLSLVDQSRPQQAEISTRAVFICCQVPSFRGAQNYVPRLWFVPCVRDFERTPRLRGSGFVLGPHLSFGMGAQVEKEDLMVL